MQIFQMPDQNLIIKRILLVYKRSIYKQQVLDGKNDHLKKLLQKKHFTTKNLIDAYKKNQKAIQMVKHIVTRHKIKCQLSARGHLQNINKYDLILALGGDGTFLRTAQHVRQALIMGINSQPGVSVGALCSVTIDDLNQKLDEILSGHYKIKELSRIQIKLNGKVMARESVNDVLFSNNSPAATSRYIIAHDHKSEEHKSSGVWISTAKGSTAAIHAAGGEIMSDDDERLQFHTRELYQGKLAPYKITKGYIESRTPLKIISKMIKSQIFLDGPTTHYPVKFGDELIFSLSKNKLRVVS